MSSDAAPLPYTVEQGDVGRNREAMLALWRGNLGDEARMLAKFDWFYRDCPFGAPSVCLLRHESEAAPVGVAVAAARRMQVDGAAGNAGLLVDLAVRPQHRSLGPAMTLQTALAETAGKRFALLYGFPNPKAAPVFKRVGYGKLGEILRHVRVLRHSTYLARRMPKPLAAIAGVFVDMGVRLRDGWRSRSDVRLHAQWSDLVDARFDALWQASAPTQGVFAIRDAAFARWRFDACPLEKTRYLLLSDANDTLLAWFACQVHEDILHVRDFWSITAAQGMSRPHVDALLRAAGAAGHVAVSVEMATRAERLAGWQATDFLVRSQRTVFGKWSDGRDASSADLYFTSADEDE